MNKSLKKYSRTHIGEIYISNQGCKLEIIDGGTKNPYCTVKIYGGVKEYVDECIYASVRDGKVKNRYLRSVFGVGYIGIGQYKSVIKGKKQKMYSVWTGMLGRAYYDEFHKKQSRYKDVEVCVEWHNYQNFAKWFEENYREFSDERTELDKDIIGDGKLYSPDTCCFVPQRLNSFMSNHKASNTTGKTGVQFSKNNKNNKYKVMISDFLTNEQLYLGYYNNLDIASNVYKKARAEQLKNVKEYCLKVWDIKDRKILDNIK